jgi:hypothetical protein
MLDLLDVHVIPFSIITSYILGSSNSLSNEEAPDPSSVVMEQRYLKLANCFQFLSWLSSKLTIRCHYLYGFVFSPWQIWKVFHLDSSLRWQARLHCLSAHQCRLQSVGWCYVFWCWLPHKGFTGRHSWCTLSRCWKECVTGVSIDVLQLLFWTNPQRYLEKLLQWNLWTHDLICWCCE